MVSVNIASIPERKEQLIKTIDSLINQCDEVNLFLNNYLENPYTHKKVNIVYSNNLFGDAGKFYFVEGFKGYYFTCDDDIIYPENYINETKKEVDLYGVVSYHGRSFLGFPIESYYRTPAIRNRCLDDYEFTEPVQIAGTGVMAFHTDYYKPNFSIFTQKNMSDIFISCDANKKGIKIMGLKHKKGYFKYQDVKNTIYEEKCDNCEFETNYVNNNFKFS